MEQYDPFRELGDTDTTADADKDLDMVRRLMGSPHGRRFIRRIMRTGGVTEAGFSDNALLSAFREGTRTAALEVMALVQIHDPHRYHLLWTEKDE